VNSLNAISLSRKVASEDWSEDEAKFRIIMEVTSRKDSRSEE